MPTVVDPYDYHVALLALQHIATATSLIEAKTSARNALDVIGPSAPKEAAIPAIAFQNRPTEAP